MRTALFSFTTASCLLISTGYGAVFTDWTSFDPATHIAQGTLDGIAVTISGDGMEFVVADGSSTGFSSGALFSPPLPTSDLIYCTGTPLGSTYTITFQNPVRDPILHLRSIASTLAFNTTDITKLSGDSTLTLSGGTVTGTLAESPYSGYDANGSIQFPGAHNTITFAAVMLPQVQIPPDGFYVQVGGLAAQPRQTIRISQVELCWDTITNNGYQLQYRSSLTTNVWMPLGEPVFGTGFPFCTNDTILRGEVDKSYRFPPGVQSTFDENSEGWTAYGNGGHDIRWSGTGGNPGGRIILTEAAPTNGWFEAPAIYCGDKGGFYGGTLRYDIYSDSSTSAQAKYAAVQLIGPTNTLQFIVSNLMTSLPVQSWTNIIIPLLASTNWTINGAKATNAAQFRSVLANLQHLRIDGDLFMGTAGPSTSLDNVRLTPHPGELEIRASQVEICWASFINTSYKVQYLSELTANQWTDLFPTNIVATSSETCIYDDIPRGRPQRFYRVVAAP